MFKTCKHSKLVLKTCVHSYLGSKDLILQPDTATSFANIQTSSVLRSLLFCQPTSMLYNHCDVTLHCMPETQEHRHIRQRTAAKHHDVTAAVSPRHGPVSSPPPSSSAAVPVSPAQVL